LKKYEEILCRAKGFGLCPQRKSLFDLLSRFENEHYLSLKDTEEYFVDSASWYRKLEHHTFDGE